MSSYTHRDVSISLLRNAETIAKGFASALRVTTRPTYHEYRKIDEKAPDRELLALEYHLTWNEAFWDDQYDEDIEDGQEYDVKLEFEDEGDFEDREITYETCVIDAASMRDTDRSFERAVSFVCKTRDTGGS